MEDKSTYPIHPPCKNRMAMASLYCLIAGIVLPFTPYLVLLAPLAFLLGIVAGIRGLMVARNYPKPRNGATQAWTSIILCTLLFTAFGFFTAQLGNYSQWPTRSSELRMIASWISVYAQDHNGHLPASITVLNIPAEQRTYKVYYFYLWCSEIPYLFNGHLANAQIDAISHPERTVLLATGAVKPTDKKLRLLGAIGSDRLPHGKRPVFYSLKDIDLAMPMVFVNGRTQKPVSREGARHTTASNAVTVDDLIIKPAIKQ